MRFKMSKTFGSTVIEFMDEANSFEDFFKKSASYFGLPGVCGVCGDSNLGISHRNVDGNDYYSVKCLVDNCGYELKYGQYKKGGLFPKKWEPPYRKKQDQPQREPAPVQGEPDW